MADAVDRRVFLVEDSAVVRESYELLFDVVEGFQVCGEAESAETALETYAASVPDIMVVDVSLPGMSGIELARKLGELSPELPVVLITGHDRDTYGKEAAAAGVAAYVMKHEGPRALLRALEGLSGSPES